MRKGRRVRACCIGRGRRWSVFSAARMAKPALRLRILVSETGGEKRVSVNDMANQTNLDDFDFKIAVSVLLDRLNESRFVLLKPTSRSTELEWSQVITLGVFALVALQQTHEADHVFADLQRKTQVSKGSLEGSSKARGRTFSSFSAS